MSNVHHFYELFVLLFLRILLSKLFLYILEILNSAFKNSALTSILIPSTVQLIGSLCFGECKSLASIDVEPANQFYKSVDHVLYI